MFKRFDGLSNGAVLAQNATFIIAVESMDSGLNPTETASYPTSMAAEVAFRYRDAGPHFILQGASRFKHGTDFTAVVNGVGQITITWNNVTALPNLPFSFVCALIDSICQ